MADITHVLYYLNKRILLSTDAVYRIGRGVDNDIIFNENTVSRNHARILFRNNRWIIEDLNSSNGTLINYTKINCSDLRDNDRIRIGPFHCIFRAVEGGEIPEYDALVGDTLMMEKKIQDIFHMLPNAGCREKLMDLKHFINTVRHKMNRMAVIDRLTGIFNRAYFDDHLIREIERAKRYAQNLWLILFDIDHFKKFNDTHGHQKGDEVLAAVALIIKENIRMHDIVARYGGEEIAIILPHITLQGARIIGEKIRKKIEIVSKERTGLCVTVSGGIASAEASRFQPETIIKNADHALYAAKKQGRNRICFYKGR